jgi:threonine synthase
MGIPASKAVLMGIAPDGGLFVPLMFPKLKIEKDEAYPALAARVLAQFFDDLPELDKLTAAAYHPFGDERVAPIVKTADGEYMLELWHGPTLAFKDMALSVLPRLLTASMGVHGGQDILILVATSGDTGKAALEGFCDVPRTRIVVFYPSEGVSDMQKLQMVTQEGKNTHVVAVKGNFDDAQNGVKAMFADEAFNAAVGEKGYSLSSANSINFGRLAPQIAYYFGAYAQLLSSGEITEGEAINFVVPTGNFGNILAGYYAKRMGLPIAKLICASNQNNVLTDFFHKGEYSLKRPFYKTMSPSMDILISSNLERLLFELTGRDPHMVSAMMKQLKETGTYDIGKMARHTLEADFWADWCGEEETKESIRQTFVNKGYLMDTHTAVAAAVYEKYKRTGDSTKTVIVSTASPYKFPQDVLASLGESTEGMDAFALSRRLSERTGTRLPQQIEALESKPVRHKAVVEQEAMRQAVLEVL